MLNKKTAGSFTNICKIDTTLLWLRSKRKLARKAGSIADPIILYYEKGKILELRHPFNG